MKKIICTDSSDYNITKGLEYEIHGETGNFYHIINDKGIQSKYSKEFFKDKKLPNIPISDFDDEDLSLVWDEGKYCLSFSSEEVSDSCGVESFSGVNTAFSEILRYYTDNFEDNYSRKELRDKAKEQFAKFVEEVFSDLNKIMIISTNDTIPEVWDVLHDKADLISDAAESDEAEHVIKVFIFYRV